MKPSEELHQLVHSLSMSEKRYFKIHSSRHIIGGTNNYTRLFDVIEAQAEYDEELVKKSFEKETFIKHLPSEKHYLYNHILESLNSFNKEKTFLARYASTLTSIEILYNRGLFSQCKKIIKKAKTEAYSLEKFSILLLLIHWETILFINAEEDKSLYINIQEELRLLDALKIQTILMQLAFDLQIQIDKGNATSKYINTRKKELNNIFPPKPEINSFWSKYYYYSALALIYTIESNNTERYRCYKEIKNIMDKAPQFIKDLPAIYHLNYNNLVNIMLFLKKYSETEALLKEQRTFLPMYGIKNPTFHTRVFINTYESELYLYYKTGQHEKAAQVAHQMESELKKIDLTFGPILFDLFYFMAITELMVKNYKGAIRWLNKILNAEREISFRKELQINARMLYLVVLNETDDVLFDNRAQSARRFMAQESSFKKQAKILEGIELAGEDLTLPKIKSALKSIIAQLKKEHQVAGEELLNKNFDFVEWLENKAR